MRVVEPHEFKNVKHPKKKRKSHRRLRIILVVVLVVYVATSLLRPLPSITTSVQALPASPVKEVAVSWPNYGQSAIGAVGYGILGTKGEPRALPTASVAKVMTALAVLKQRPLAVGEQGPIITIIQSDVDEYARTIAMDGSNVAVALGEEITQYQALQALLLPSANNMAHTLARWAFGTEQEYLRFVNNFAKSLGMANTNFVDASGFSEKTVSTAEDLVKLAVNAMDNPVIAEIASQKQATIPVAGQIFNVNLLLGRNGIVGVKTGNTEQAGGCFMAAAVREVGGKKVIAVSVIMGAPNLYTALQDSVPLVNSVLDGLTPTTLVLAGQTVGQTQASWGSSVKLAAKNTVSGVNWPTKSNKPNINVANSIKTPIHDGQRLGVIEAQFGREISKTDVIVVGQARKPSLLWRLTPWFLH